MKNFLKGLYHEHKSFFSTLILALFFAGIIRSFLFEPFHIPSGSMKPNLLVGDYIIVSKYTYGYSRYSFPFGFKIFEGRKMQSRQPKRGDVVVFRLPQNPSINYIKRIVGLPGDTIQMRGGILYINEHKIDKKASGVFAENAENDLPTQIEQSLETIDGTSFKTIDLYKGAPQDDTGLYDVPEGHYFMMGDNRDNSQDSRFLEQLGFVPEENIVGKARFIFFSSSKPIWQFWNLGHSVRTDRIFKTIE